MNGRRSRRELERELDHYESSYKWATRVLDDLHVIYPQICREGAIVCPWDRERNFLSWIRYEDIRRAAESIRAKAEAVNAREQSKRDAALVEEFRKAVS